MNLKLSDAGFAIQTAAGEPEDQPAFSGPVAGDADGLERAVQMALAREDLAEAWRLACRRLLL